MYYIIMPDVSGKRYFKQWGSNCDINNAKHFSFEEADEITNEHDNWRLYEAGIKNSVGIFGADLSDDQLIALESLSIFNVIILTDADEAGNKAANNIIEKCGRRFNYYRPNIPTKDVGDMTVEQIEHILKPQIKGLF